VNANRDERARKDMPNTHIRLPRPRHVRRRRARSTTSHRQPSKTMSDNAQGTGLAARAPPADEPTSTAPAAGTTTNAPDAPAPKGDGLQPRRYENWGARNVTCYEKLEQVGEGTYGQVRCDTQRRDDDGGGGSCARPPGEGLRSCVRNVVETRRVCEAKAVY
jgi:hypothetical protein